jgi:outer membrane protein TolC
MMTVVHATVARRATLSLLAFVTFASAVEAQDTLPRRELVPAAQAVALPDAIQMALRVRPAMAQAMATARNAEAQKRSAFGAYLPNLNATSGGTMSFQDAQTNSQGIPIPASSRTNYNVGLNASLNLFNGFKRQADDRAAQATVEAADAGLTDAEFQTSLVVTQQFFDALAAQQLVRVREAGVRRGEEQLALSVAKLRVGSATRSDSLRSTVNLGSAQLALINALSDVARTQSTLGRTLGLETRVGAQDDSSFYNFTLGLDTAALQQEALARSPRVQAAEASARSADAALKASRSSYWPSLNLSGQTNWNAQSDFDYQMVGNRSVGLNLSWPLFDRFQREQTIANRQGSLDVAEANAADARREIQASLTTQFAALRAAQVRIDITRASVEAANEDLRVVNERYRVGAATILDVLNSQEALAQADVDAISARFDYLRAKAQIEALIGRIL